MHVRRQSRCNPFPPPSSQNAKRHHSETFGSILCPAAETGATALRPSAGAAGPHIGALRVAPSLDKAGAFCRQALDCFAVALALAPAPTPAPSGAPSGCAAAGGGGAEAELPSLPPPMPFASEDEFRRAHLPAFIPAAAAVVANGSSSAAAPSQAAPLCLGFLGASPAAAQLAAALRARGACVKGPLPPPPGAAGAADISLAILTAEVAVTFAGLERAGLVRAGTRWAEILARARRAPPGAYAAALRARTRLEAAARAYFRRHGVGVVAKDARAAEAAGGGGLDALPALLGLPELVLPVGFEAVNATEAEAQDQQQDGGGGRGGGGGVGGGGGAPVLQPLSASLFAPRGGDAAVVAVGDAFQRATRHHLRRPPLERLGQPSGTAGRK